MYVAILLSLKWITVISEWQNLDVTYVSGTQTNAARCSNTLLWRNKTLEYSYWMGFWNLWLKYGSVGGILNALIGVVRLRNIFDPILQACVTSAEPTGFMPLPPIRATGLRCCLITVSFLEGFRARLLMCLISMHSLIGSNIASSFRARVRSLRLRCV